MRTVKFIVIGIALLASLAIGALVIWANDAAQPMPEAVLALDSEPGLAITDDRQWITFLPDDNQAASGLIYYPGGRVDARAYAPFARQIAQAGYLVVIVRMPLNLAVLAPNSAQGVINTFPEIKSWTIAGHSLGGAMAATFAETNDDLVDGLLLIASYPPSNIDLSDNNLLVSSVYGSRDGLASVQNVVGAMSQLPENTLWVPIEGGNHAQFGWYGDQPGDLPAYISRTEQTQQLVTAAQALIESLPQK